MTTNSEMQYGTVGRASESTEEQLRASARRRVAGAARGRGERPSDAFPADDVAWAFKGHEAELADLEAEAERVRDAQARARPYEDVAQLRHETEAVLREWDDERRAKAVREARRRLRERRS